ncbi:MAG: methylenetetrahydrofolate--tRNA-(uracil(54)-C(5))-methyltransferase (FADH(2)-oxidizing) TrmFO [Firmicutes bacterium]|nr:methylenetetrahydrofolate--tRNA-(uracil(54)-C(5))-methyltransferase (FADH(2)-oxidizing) TrmFO [Bacillota bacterium]
MQSVTVIGAGLAGCEAAYQIAKRGISVTLYEAKPGQKSAAHKSNEFAELVCSNSLKSTDPFTAHGLLKEELRLLDSLILRCAEQCRIPAGGALAVDREMFAKTVTAAMHDNPLITVVHETVDKIPQGGITIVATGPLTLGKLAEELAEKFEGNLSFYDAAAPIVSFESIDMGKAFFASRYGKTGVRGQGSGVRENEELGVRSEECRMDFVGIVGVAVPGDPHLMKKVCDGGSLGKHAPPTELYNDGDYLNCPLTQEEYYAFVDALIKAERAPLKEFDTGHKSCHGVRLTDSDASSPQNENDNPMNQGYSAVSKPDPLTALSSASHPPYEAFQTTYESRTPNPESRIVTFEGCMPIEAMAARGRDTLRFGPLKPVGLIDPATGKRPFAVVQLRKENAAGEMFNLVGFQTNLKFPEQRRVFGMIPALKNAEFLRYGVMHRNTFLNAPNILNRRFQVTSTPHLFIAGQLSGVEGYVESAASGLLAGMYAAIEFMNCGLWIVKRMVM